jgi:hypothetical protein
MKANVQKLEYFDEVSIRNESIDTLSEKLKIKLNVLKKENSLLESESEMVEIQKEALGKEHLSTLEDAFRKKAEFSILKKEIEVKN